MEIDIPIHLRVHFRSVVSYAMISATFLFLQPYLHPPYDLIINLTVMSTTIGSMIILNALRLRYFLVNSSPNEKLDPNPKN